jgi:ubiquinone/menaquinone biosynthesis C-methylase UbiE
MLKWFRKGPSPYQTALAMVGAKHGDQVVLVGATDVDLAAQLALVTGLNGQTTVIDRSEEQGRVDAAAAKVGALVEFGAAPPTTLPTATGSVDVLVVSIGLGSLDPSQRTKTIEEAMRVLRPGGRTIVIEGIPPPRQTANAERPPIDAADVLALLESVGGKAVRTLATVDGRTYFEARKPRTDPA